MAFASCEILSCQQHELKTTQSIHSKERCDGQTDGEGKGDSVIWNKQ